MPLNEQPPTFFVPDVTSTDQEEAYGMMAGVCGRPPLPAKERIFSIVYMHDGVECTATVGNQLHGTKTTVTRGRERRTPHSDPATVLAIFKGNPYLVVTSAPPFGNARSAWTNPFMAGTPKRVTLFRQPENSN